MHHCLAHLAGLVCAAALASQARAETLDLPVDSAVIRGGSVEFIRVPRTEAVAAEAQPDAGGVHRSLLGIDLPPGARVIYSGPAPPWAAAARPGVTAEPSGEVAEAVTTSAARHGVSRWLVEAVAWQESRFDQGRVSPKGAQGVMQLMPRTAATLGADVSDLRGNIDGGAAYLALLIRRFSGDLSLAIAAYNAGPEAVERHRGIPPNAETQAYVKAVLARLQR